MSSSEYDKYHTGGCGGVGLDNSDSEQVNRPNKKKKKSSAFLQQSIEKVQNKGDSEAPIIENFLSHNNQNTNNNLNTSSEKAHQQAKPNSPKEHQQVVYGDCLFDEKFLPKKLGSNENDLKEFEQILQKKQTTPAITTLTKIGESRGRKSKEKQANTDEKKQDMDQCYNTGGSKNIQGENGGKQHQITDFFMMTKTSSKDSSPKYE